MCEKIFLIRVDLTLKTILMCGYIGLIYHSTDQAYLKNFENAGKKVMEKGNLSTEMSWDTHCASVLPRSFLTFLLSTSSVMFYANEAVKSN